jgi:hypothetical protein
MTDFAPLGGSKERRWVGRLGFAVAQAFPFRRAKPRREEWAPWNILKRAFSPQTQLQNLTWGFAPSYKIAGLQPANAASNLAGF